MGKFKLKKKHLTGEIADFPKRVVQAMVDEQVRQGNPADPSVFSIWRFANKREGGFTWMETATGYSWPEIILYKKFHLIPKREKPRCPDSTTRTEATPHEIIQNMLDKGMVVWVCVSDKSDMVNNVHIRGGMAHGSMAEALADGRVSEAEFAQFAHDCRHWLAGIIGLKHRFKTLVVVCRDRNP